MGVVKSLWIGSDLSELQQLSIRSFLVHGHDYELYTYGDVKGIPTGTIVCDGTSILPKDSIFCYPNGFGKGSYSAFSNLFRYKLLFEQGGWWVDTDLVCLKPFDFDDEFVFATELDDDGVVGCATCAFSCPPGAAVLDYCVQVVEARDKGTLEWGQIGPQLLTEAVARFDLAAHCVPVETFNPVNYFDFSCMSTAGFDMSRVAGSHAVHFWNQMWKNNGSDVTSAPRDSLYEILRRRYIGPAVAAATC